MIVFMGMKQWSIAFGYLYLYIDPKSIIYVLFFVIHGKKAWIFLHIIKIDDLNPLQNVLLVVESCVL